MCNNRFQQVLQVVANYPLCGQNLFRKPFVFSGFQPEMDSVPNLDHTCIHNFGSS